MCGARKAEDGVEGRGKREEEGELGRTRTKVRQTRYPGDKIEGGAFSQAHECAGLAPEREHLLKSCDLGAWLV